MTDAPEPPITARLALVGAASLLGTEVKEQLAASDFPGEAVALFDIGDLAGVLTDYGEEARVFAKAVAARVLGHELACFCGDPRIAADYLDPLLEANRLGLDCTGAWLADERAFAWIPGVSPPPRLEEHRAVVIPTASTLLMGAAATALGDAAADATAGVLLPASERGDRGIEELSQQSTAVLNLLEVEQEVFGRRQAFDVWVPDDDDELGAARLVATLERIGCAVPAVQVLAAPVFHGIALSLFVAGARATDVDRALRDGGFAGSESAKAGTRVDSPVRAVGRPGWHASAARDDAHRDGAWVWVVADNLQMRAAAAVAAIHTLLGTPISDALQ